MFFKVMLAATAALFWNAELQAEMNSGAEPNQGHTADSQIEIDRIDIQGIKVFTPALIETALAVAPGDILQRLKVVRTEENLQALYISHGYEEVRIKSRLVRKKTPSKKFETVLEFEVYEGNPVKIAQIKLILEGPQDEVSIRARKEREPKIRASIYQHPGDILDQEKIALSKRAIQEFLVSEDYIGAKVEVLREVTQATYQGPIRLVNLEFYISLGDRVRFGFRGNTVFTRGFFDGMVDEQRLIGLGKDYVGAIKAQLEDLYHEAGYARVEITPYMIESPYHVERKITYVIREGPRVKLESINFEGNVVFSSQSLRERFYAKASGLVQHGYYVEKDVQQAVDFLIEWMKEKGYLSSRVITLNTIYLLKPRTQQPNGVVNLEVYLYEGDQTLVQNFLVEGGSVLKQEEIETLLKIKSGKPLNLFAFGEGLEVLKKLYRDRGYLGFKILNEGAETLVQYLQENRFADITLQLEEGPQFRLSRIEVEGLVNTKLQTVLRELHLEEGQVLTESKLIQCERQLRRLGIFSSVTIRPSDDPGRSGHKIVRIVLQEADRGILTGGPGFRNDLGARLFGQFGYSNLWGLNHTASITASANRRVNNLYQFAEGQAQFAYSWPWFGLPDLTFRPTASIARIQYIDFAADTLSIATSWEKPISSKPILVPNLTYTLERIGQFNAFLPTDNQTLTVGTVTPKLTLDCRDNPLLPKSGLFAIAWFDWASPYFGSWGASFPIGYYRIQFRSDYYISLWKDIVWYLSFRTGYERSTEHTRDLNNPATDPNQDAIPLIKQFSLGGVNSLRGYQEQELNQQQTIIYGSLAYVNYRTQVDLPFSGALKLGIFVDAANLLVDNFSFGGLLYGTGFGLHYQTPVGAVSFDWGFKVNPPANADPYVIHFSVGVI